jgi:hypothetical protein
LEPPDNCGGDADCGEVVLHVAVESRCDPVLAFDAPEGSLNDVSLAVELFVVEVLDLAAFRGGITGSLPRCTIHSRSAALF